MFIDSAQIWIRSGKGGDGAVSFRREKYVPKGGPDGGDGGDGGHVYALACPEVDTLLDFAGRHHWRASDGEAGGRKQCHGKNGEDLILRVPVGTVFFDDDTGEKLVDLDFPNAKFCLAKGGRGGFGNEHFKTATHQTPREFTPGEPSEERNLTLELKLVADIGLVGMPNAGKSTLISTITKAHPKIADYPFTTLAPSLGIAELDPMRRLVIADIPGLIEGASEGSGLGHQFLRHIERTGVLFHMIEAAPIDGTDPVDNFRIIEKELTDYSQLLSEKPRLLVISKMDLIPEEDQETFLDLIKEEIDLEPIPISSATGLGLQKLLEEAWQIRGQKRPAWQTVTKEVDITNEANDETHEIKEEEN